MFVVALMQALSHLQVEHMLILVLTQMMLVWVVFLVVPNETKCHTNDKVTLSDRGSTVH